MSLALGSRGFGRAGLGRVEEWTTPGLQGILAPVAFLPNIPNDEAYGHEHGYNGGNDADFSAVIIAVEPRTGSTQLLSDMHQLGWRGDRFGDDAGGSRHSRNVVNRSHCRDARKTFAV